MAIGMRANSPENIPQDVAFFTPSPQHPSPTFTAICSRYLNTGRIVLPRNDRLVNQLCGLERRTARSGKDCIDHAPGQHDDLANSVAGAADLVALAERRAPRCQCRPRGAASVPTILRRCVERIEEEMRQAVPICSIDFNLPNNQ